MMSASAFGALPVSEEYSLRTWNIDNGLPCNVVTSIAQTPDGYLWLATPAGLTRFDGARFTAFPKTTTPGLESNYVETVFASKEGDLWIGFGKGGVSRRCGEQFSVVVPDEVNPETSGWITSFAQDRNGAVWFARAAEPKVWHWLNGKVFPENGAVGLGIYCNLYTSAAGRIWFADSKGCGVFDGSRFQAVDSEGGDWVRIAPSRGGGVWAARAAEKVLRYGENGEKREIATLSSLGISPKVSALYEDHAGDLWFGTLGYGLFRLHSGMVERIPTSHPCVVAITEDREGNLWVGTHGGGLNRLRRTPFSMRQEKHGLVQNSAMSLTEDSEGRLWVAGWGGTSVRSTDNSKSQFVAPTGIPETVVAMALCADPAGGIWLATLKGLMHWKDGVLHREPLQEALTALLVDRRGDLWIASIHNGLYRRRNGALERIPQENGLTNPRALAEGASGCIWVGNEKGEIFRQEQEHFVPVPLPGMNSGQIRFIVPESKDVVWIGALEGGLYRWHSGNVTHLPHETGLPDHDLRSLQIGRNGDLWFGTTRGLFRVARYEMDAVMAGRGKSLNCVSFGRNEGIPEAEFAFGFRGSASRTHDGHLWFGTYSGALEVDPDRWQQPVPSGAVLIEGIQVSGKWMNASRQQNIELPPRPGPVQIRYTLPYFSAPEHLRFSYRLLGLGDDEWMPAEAQRMATFTHLPPGDYRFEVTATVVGESWTPQVASFIFTVHAAWWQRMWFRVGVGIVGALSFAALVRFVVKRRLRMRMREIEQMHALERERTRIARDMHDQLGANLTQIALLAELAGGGECTAQLANSARQAVAALDNVVWAVNPKKDTLASLLQYLVRFTEEFLKSADLRCQIDVPANVPYQHLSPDFRHHVFLIVREAMNNAVKYAAATEIRLSAAFDQKGLTLSIVDNGRGFEPAAQSRSENGLSNIRERAGGLGGECRIESRYGAGTCVTLTVPWPPDSSV